MARCTETNRINEFRLLSASARNQSWYLLQTELLHSYSSLFSQTGIAISGQLKISDTYLSIEYRSKVSPITTAKKQNWAIKPKEFVIELF